VNVPGFDVDPRIKAEPILNVLIEDKVGADAGRDKAAANPHRVLAADQAAQVAHRAPVQPANRRQAMARDAVQRPCCTVPAGSRDDHTVSNEKPSPPPSCG